MMKRIVLKQWIDNWMRDKYHFAWSWETIEQMEGGHGENRCRTIADALSRPTTWPYFWFKGNQLDTNFYSEPSYIYSLFWAAHKFSSQTYKRAFHEWNLAGKVTADIGGSLFTALECLELGATEVLVYNLLGTPQSDIILDFVREFGAPIKVNNDPDFFKHYGRVFFYKAYLEHFPVVDNELDKWFGEDHTPRGSFIFDNSFCEIAYGHYIPIKVDGVLHDERSAAEAAFIGSMMKNYGFNQPDSFNKSATKMVWRFTR